MKDQLLAKMHDHTAVVAVVGLGYVGWPRAVACAKQGFPVVDRSQGPGGQPRRCWQRPCGAVK